MGEDPGSIPHERAEPEDIPANRILASQPPEKIKTVLNSGMEFLAGLMEMATGQRMETGAGQKKMIEIDRLTGEVTLKFRLPSF